MAIMATAVDTTRFEPDDAEHRRWVLRWISHLDLCIRVALSREVGPVGEMFQCRWKDIRKDVKRSSMTTVFFIVDNCHVRDTGFFFVRFSALGRSYAATSLHIHVFHHFSALSDRSTLQVAVHALLSVTIHSFGPTA